MDKMKIEYFTVFSCAVAFSLYTHGQKFVIFFQQAVTPTGRFLGEIIVLEIKRDYFSLNMSNVT